MIGLVTATAAGRSGARQLAERWPDTRTYPLADLATAWAECDAIVCFLAVGAAVRLVAPLLVDKRSDPGLVCVDEAHTFAVAVLGGHRSVGGSNELASRVADALGATAVLTTATDATGIAALDELGWPYEGDIAGVTRALLDGDPVALWSAETWPLPALGAEPVEHLADLPADRPAIVVSDELNPTGSFGQHAYPMVLLRPPSLRVGVGASRGVTSAEILDLLDRTLTEAGLAAGSIAEIATVEAKADEAGILEAARLLSVPVTIQSSQALASIDVPNPSEVVRAAVGTPSVAEAAALSGGGDLVVGKRKSAVATVAVVRMPSRGRLAVVGIGPGTRELLTAQARSELRRAAVVIGLDQYVDQVRDLLRPATRILATGLGAESERARSAVEWARAGYAVALIGSGDAGIYAMASPALEEADDSFDVVAAPGITAMLAAAGLLGAPLGHDHAVISLSDLHTPWEIIERRVTAAAQGDFVVAFYNPRSRGRDWQLPKALAILSGHRPSETPVGIVTDATRPAQQTTVTTLAELDVEIVGMTSMVIVGASSSRIIAGRFVTPRGYRWATEPSLGQP